MGREVLLDKDIYLTSDYTEETIETGLPFVFELEEPITDAMANGMIRIRLYTHGANRAGAPNPSLKAELELTGNGWQESHSFSESHYVQFSNLVTSEIEGETTNLREGSTKQEVKFYGGENAHKITLATDKHSNPKYRPYINIFSSYRVPSVSNLRVRRTPINPLEPIVLEWDYDGVGDGTQEKFMLEYQVGNEEPVKISEETSRQSYTIPAGTLPESAMVYWELTATDSTYNTQSTKGSSSFRTIGIKPYITNLSPKDEVVNPVNKVAFQWKHNSKVGGIQGSFILKYSINGGDWITIAEDSSREYLTVPGKTFPGDATVRWSIQTVDSKYGTTTNVYGASFTTMGIKPYVRGLTPNGGIVSSRNPIMLSWSHNSVVGGTQRGFILKYTTDEESWTEITEATSRESYTIPGLEFTGEQTVTWKVKTTDSVYENESDFEQASFRTGVTAQRSPVITAPFGEYLDAGDDISLEWIFMGHPGEFQAKYEVNWSRNNGVTWSEIERESINNYHIVAGNSFPTGTITWRVRTYNQYDEVSPWSDLKTFYLIGRPATPVITSVTNYSKPTVRWTSDSQQVYELEILRGAELIYSSGRIASVSTFEHYVDQYLPNGNYRARLRVKNRYDLWSDYGERGFTINRANPPRPNIAVEGGEYKVTIRGSGLSNRSYVYREGILLGEMIGEVYEDYTGANNKEYSYFIRTINEEENFSDSENAFGKCSFKGNTLALASSPKEFLLLRFNLSSRPVRKMSIGNQGSFIEFDGRDYPSYEFSDMKTFTKDLTFSIKEENLVELERLMDGKGPLIFRDHFGENTNGIVESINATRVLGGYTIDFTINKVKKEV